MKKFSAMLLLLLLPAFAWAQSILQAENFQIGTVLKFQTCVATGVNPGNPGTNQLWDFSNLNQLPDVRTTWIVPPTATPFASQYPTANLVEKSSDGKLVYVNKSPQASLLVGFADTVNNTTFHYPNAMLVAKRPLTFGAIHADSFTTNFTASGFTFTCRGLATMEADGFGTLILPTGTFNNVLRVKITINQADKLLQFGTVKNSTTVIYAWFDNFHTSALLKMDATTSGSFSQQSVSYLLNEVSGPTGIAATVSEPAFSFYPNPAVGAITFKTPKKGTVIIHNAVGQTVKKQPVVTEETVIEVEGLAPGMYTLTLENQHTSYRAPLIISHK